MRDGDPGTEVRRPLGDPTGVARGHLGTGQSGGSNSASVQEVEADQASWVIETIVSPFHCLYQDALHFHSESRLRLARSESEASRLARGALLLYLASAEALVHQAAAELGRPELSELMADPLRPMPLADAWRLLPAIVAEKTPGSFDAEAPPWPQFTELLSLRESWAHPGPAPQRRAYYRSPRKDAAYEPLEPHRIPAALDLSPEALTYPRTGLPRDPYALRPRHLDTARGGKLDAAIEVQPTAGSECCAGLPRTASSPRAGARHLPLTTSSSFEPVQSTV